MKRYRGSNN